MTEKQVMALMEIYFRQKEVLALDYRSEEKILVILFVDNGGNVHRQGILPTGEFRTYQP